MDSITQMVLGAAVGSALMGHKVGARAAVWGAVCGTLPDLDVYIPMGDAVADFTYHRSFSHSLFVLAALTPLLVWLILKLHPGTRSYRARWGLTIYAVFATHVLLDSLTVYGTQIFWPLSDYPVSIGSVFIIDPAYTLPLLVGVLVALVLRYTPRGVTANRVGLVLSTAYLLWGLGAQAHVRQLAQDSMAATNHHPERLLVQPTPFNSLLWRIVAVDRDHYRVGYHSLMDSSDTIQTVRYDRNPELLASLQSHWPVERLKGFTHGFYTVDSEDNGVIISDLRMGVEPDFAFRFKVAELGNPHPVPVAATRLPNQAPWERLPGLFRRIWDEPTTPDTFQSQQSLGSE